MKVNVDKLQDEMRKLGSIFIASGAVGFALEEKIGAQIAFLAILAGIGFIFFGATSWSKREEENHGAK